MFLGHLKIEHSTEVQSKPERCNTAMCQQLDHHIFLSPSVWQVLLASAKIECYDTNTDPSLHVGNTYMSVSIMRWAYKVQYTLKKGMYHSFNILQWNGQTYI
jgi:hypothetical protein